MDGGANVDQFDQPKIVINRVYTRVGDNGETALVGGQRVGKDDARIACFGTVDELNAFVGAARITVIELGSPVQELAGILHRVQHELFNAGSILATLPADIHPRQPRITALEITTLEEEIDRMNAPLVPLRSFVLPGGSRASTELHICRTVCRRAERLLTALPGRDQDTLKYLNRLSDAFFVWSRWVNNRLNVPETLWQPNEAASGHGITEEKK